MILYDDPAKQAKLEEAIKLGFINRQLDPDGVYRYILTPQGQNEFMLYKMGLKR